MRVVRPAPRVSAWPRSGGYRPRSTARDRGHEAGSARCRRPLPRCTAAAGACLRTSRATGPRGVRRDEQRPPRPVRRGLRPPGRPGRAPRRGGRARGVAPRAHRTARAALAQPDGHLRLGSGPRVHGPGLRCPGRLRSAPRRIRRHTDVPGHAGAAGGGPPAGRGPLPGPPGRPLVLRRLLPGPVPRRDPALDPLPGADSAHRGGGAVPGHRHRPGGHQRADGLRAAALAPAGAAAADRDGAADHRRAGPCPVRQGRDPGAHRDRRGPAVRRGRADPRPGRERPVRGHRHRRAGGRGARRHDDLTAGRHPPAGRHGALAPARLPQHAR